MAIAVALLVSADPVTIQQVGYTLKELSISPDICQEIPASIRLVNCRKFDAIVVDLQLGKDAALILDAVRLSPSNMTAVTFVVSGSDANTTAALRKKANFVLERPLSAKAIRSILKPAYGLILRERRRYFRCPVAVPVTILRQGMMEVRCHSVNISEGGMALSTFVSLRAGEEVQVQFTLPDHKIPFVAESKVCWWKTGHIGVRFVSLSQEHDCELKDWLSQKLEEMLPEIVAGKFQKAENCTLSASADSEHDQRTGAEVSSRPTEDQYSDAEQKSHGTGDLSPVMLEKSRVKNQKVLLVNGEPAALACYRQMLEGKFDIATAASVREGLAALRDHGPFAVVISDMQMAGMDGMRFLKRVRQVAPNTIRLLVTGNLDLNGAVHAINDGCVFRVLTKPYEKSLLTEAITKALDCYHERKEERVRIELPVRLCRAAPGLKLHLAHTVDISNSGVRLAGLEEPLELGEVVKLECGNRKAPFRVVWIGAQGTINEGQTGLECLAADADLWKVDLSQMEDAKLLMRARAVQRGLLAQEKPPLATLDYAGRCVQARTIGGDYYDFLDMGPGEVGFVLADIAGKGIAAALLMACLQGSLYSQYSTGSKDIPQLLASVNRHFYKHTARDRYATLFFGRYSDTTRTLHYVNCGHNPPLLLHNGNAVERLGATATVLGLFSDWDCSVAETHLETGDVLSIYTDGITETTGHSGEEFGEARLLDTLRRNRNLEAACILRNVEDATKQFRLGEQEDDLTLVIARAL